MGLRLRGGKWTLRKKIGGKRHEICLGYPEAEKAKAAKAAVKIVSQLLDQHHGLAPKPEDEKVIPTFSAWWDRYKAVYSAKKSKPGRDESIVGWWLMVPFGNIIWGDAPLDQFKQSDCEAALARRREAGTLNPAWKKQRQEVSEATVQRERGLIQAMFERAMDDGIIERNPWKGVEKEQAEARMRLLVAEDQAKLMAVLTPQFQRFVGFLLETGLRLDDVRKITSDDIIATSIHIHGKGRKRRTVCQQCKRMGGKCRNVPLTARATELLQEQHDAEGKLWTQHPARLREVLQVGCERAQIGHLSPHDLRHTFGHRWLQRGGDVFTLSKVLGHSSVVITEKHYAHLLQPDIEAKMKAVMEPTKLRIVRSA